MSKKLQLHSDLQFVELRHSSQERGGANHPRMYPPGNELLKRAPVFLKLCLGSLVTS